jgi:hypothetical protein
MKITMQFNFESIEEFSAWAAKLAGEAPVVAMAAPESAPAEPIVIPSWESLTPAVPGGIVTPTPTKRGRPAKIAVAPTPEPAAPAAVEPAEPASPIKVGVPAAPVEAAPTLDEVKAKLEAVFNKHGFQGAQQLLAAVGVSRLRDATPAQYPVLLAEADKRLA